MPTSPVSGTEKALLAAREPLSGAQALTWRGGGEGGVNFTGMVMRCEQVVEIPLQNSTM